MRSQASTFGSNLSVVQNRQDFNKNLMQRAADRFVDDEFADTNEEGANRLMGILAIQLLPTVTGSARPTRRCCGCLAKYGNR